MSYDLSNDTDCQKVNDFHTSYKDGRRNASGFFVVKVVKEEYKGRASCIVDLLDFIRCAFWEKFAKHSIKMRRAAGWG